MRYRLTALFIFCMFGIAKGQFAGLIVNEFSQGNAGSREYIELLVVGSRTCTDSTADLRGWIFDDQNGWYGNTNGASGHYRFANVDNWSAVPFGSIILLYNSANGEKNLSITLPDDATDADKDHTYILPIASSAFIEEHDSEPTSVSGPDYIYPAANSTAGYSGASNTWITHISLNNTGDVIGTISPSDRTSAFFSIGYGFTITTSYKTPTVSIGPVVNGAGAYLSSANYTSVADWIIAPVPANETPGLPNGGANTAWINTMRTQRPIITTAAMTNHVCFSNSAQITMLAYTATNNPALYSITWNPSPANSFAAVSNATLPAGIIQIPVPAGTPAGVYDGSLTVGNASGQSCNSVPFTLTILSRPIVAVSPSSISFCEGSGVNLTASGAGSFVWSPASGLSSVTGANVAANPLSTQTYIVTGTDVNGCFDTAMATITVIPTPGSPTVTVQDNCNGTSQLTASNFTGSLLWNNGAITSAITVSTGGIYSVSHIVDGCKSAPMSAVASPLNTPAKPLIAVLQQPSCSDATGTINITEPTGIDLQYSIDGTNYQPSTTFTTLSPAGYSVTVRNTGGCVSLPAPVFIVPAPPVPSVPVLATVQPGCLTAVGSITVTNPTGSGITYSLNGSIFQSSPVFNNLLPGAYNVRARNIQGCISPVTTTVLVRSGITTVKNITVCIQQGESYTLGNQALTTTGNYTQTFSSSTGCDSTVHLYLLVTAVQRQNLTGCDSIIVNGVRYVNSVTLSDTLRSAVTNCDSLYRITAITVNKTPVPVTINVCRGVGESYTFNGAVLVTSGIYRARLLSANGCDSVVQLRLTIAQAKDTIITSCQSVSYRSKIYTSSTILNETVPSVISGCDSIIQTVNIVVLPQPQLLAPSSQAICKGQKVLLKAASNVLVEWIGFGSDSIVVSPQTTTTYTAVSMNNAGCTNKAEVVITVNEFDVHLSASANPVISGTNVQLSGSSPSSFNIIKWQPERLFGGTTAVRPVITIDSTVEIIVWAKGTNGCTDSAAFRLVVNPINDIYVPSVFTPNGDGRNDLFKILGGEFTSFELNVFNRWGQIVFSTKERTRGWDGRFNGNMQPAEVYVYVLKGNLKNGAGILKKGTVLLVR